MTRANNQYTRIIFFSETHKECSNCSVIKEHTEFHKDKTNSYGLAYYCKECANHKARLFHKKQKKSNLRYTEAKRDSYFKFKYGISLQEYQEKLAQQNYECAICKVKLLAQGHGTHLDHCHKTGKLRAFLCTNCNRGLGHFQDNRHFLKNAIEYLNTHNNDVDIVKGVSNQ